MGNKGRNVIKAAVWCMLTCIWMLVIFLLSARNADESTEDSNRVGMFIGKIFVSDFEDMSEAEKLEFAEKMEYPVRKAAHATEYAVLAVLSFASVNALCGVKGKGCTEKDEESEGKRNSDGNDEGSFLSNKLMLLLAWAWTVVYACTDEIHQLFVPGRSGQLTDVLIDSAGAGMGLLCCVLLRLIVARKMKKKSSQ